MDLAYWKENIKIGIERRYGEIENLQLAETFIEKCMPKIKELVYKWCATKKNLKDVCRKEVDYFLSDDAMYFDLKFSTLSKKLYALAEESGFSTLAEVKECKTARDVAANEAARHRAEIKSTIIVNIASDLIAEYCKEKFND